LAPDYEELYRPVFHRPHTYIRFSSTVEECGCVGYIMDDEDKRWFDDWLANQAANAPTNTGNTTSGTRRGGTPSRPVFDEDMFEDIMDVLEDLADRHVSNHL
jgi:enhancer of polycomb-like protein